MGRLPGAHVLTVVLREMKTARIKSAEANAEILRLTLEAAPQLKDGETVVLPSKILPFRVQLHRRHGNGSHVAVHCLVEGESDELRLARMRRALNHACPKLAAWSRDGRRSVLVLEANDDLSSVG